MKCTNCCKTKKERVNRKKKMKRMLVEKWFFFVFVIFKLVYVIDESHMTNDIDRRRRHRHHHENSLFNSIWYGALRPNRFGCIWIRHAVCVDQCNYLLTSLNTHTKFNVVCFVKRILPWNCVCQHRNLHWANIKKGRPQIELIPTKNK